MSRALLVLLFFCLCPRPAPAATESDAQIVRRLQKAALERAGIGERPFRGMLARMRLSALLPKVSLTLGQGLVLTESVRGTQALDQVTTTDGDHQSYAVSAHFDLSRLLFGREEMALQNEAQRAAMTGMALAREVAHVYYERQRLLRELAAAPDDAHRRQQVAELGADLEAMTGLTGLAEVPGLPEPVPGLQEE